MVKLHKLASVLVILRSNCYQEYKLRIQSRRGISEISTRHHEGLGTSKFISLQCELIRQFNWGKFDHFKGCCHFVFLVQLSFLFSWQLFNDKPLHSLHLWQYHFLLVQLCIIFPDKYSITSLLSFCHGA